MNAKSVLAILLLVVAVGSPTLAQLAPIVIAAEETWATDRVLTTSVVVENGGKLIIEAGVRVNIHYVDIFQDGQGDVKLEVKRGGTLIIKGTPGNPVIFAPVGAPPPAGSEKRHWQGIVMAASGHSTDQLNFFEVHNASIGLTIADSANVTGGVTGGRFFNNEVAGIVVQGGGLPIELIGCEVHNSAGKGMVVHRAGALLKSVKVSGAAGHGIEIDATGVTVEWAEVTGAATGIYNAPGRQVQITHSRVWGNERSGLFNDAGTVTLAHGDFSQNGRSGLFNLDGTVTVHRSRFARNAFHGVVNSSGTLTLSESRIAANASRGIIAAGASTTTLVRAAMVDNSHFGVDITPVKMRADTLVIAGSTETPGPAVVCQVSNLYGNNGTGPEVNSTVGSNPQADFTTNWWGQVDGVGELVQVATPGSVDYSHWSIEPGLEHSAELAPEESIAIDYPEPGQTVFRHEPIEITWSSEGNIPYVVIAAAHPAISDTVANRGAYRYTPTTLGSSAISVKKWNDETIQDAVEVVVKKPLVLTYPADGDTLYGREAVTIRWTASSRLANLKISYTDRARHPAVPVTIAPSTPAASGAYTWTVPNIASAAVRLDLESVAHAEEAADSATHVVTPTPDHLPGGAWHHPRTSNNMIVHFNDVFMQFPDPDGPAHTIQRGAETIYVGAFYQVDGAYRCAGYTRVDYDAGGQASVADIPVPHPATLTIWGDDISATEVDGAPPGAELRFRIWRLHWDERDPENETPAGDPQARRAEPTFPVTYEKNATVELGDLVYERSAVFEEAPGEEVHKISFENAGWYMISSFVEPAGNALDHRQAGNILGLSAHPDSLQGIADPDSVVLKNGAGEVYWILPDSSVVGELSGWNYRDGYYIRVKDRNALTLVGRKVVPEQEPLPLREGWNLAAYFRDSEMALQEALTSIAADIWLAKNPRGVYWPEYGIDEIGTIKPGEGSLIKMKAAGVLRYPANTSAASRFAPAVRAKAPTFYQLDYNSYASSVIAILSESLQGIAAVDDEIGVFNPQGVLVGSSLFDGGNLGILVWGAGEDRRNDNGMQPGEAYSFRRWNSRTGQETELPDAVYRTGSGLFEVNGVSVIAEFAGSGAFVGGDRAIPDRFELAHAYPNPFNPSVTIQFALPEEASVQLTVYDVLGRTVARLIDDTLATGYHAIEFDAGSLASGVYFYKITAGPFSQTRKMSLVK